MLRLVVQTQIRTASLAVRMQRVDIVANFVSTTCKLILDNRLNRFNRKGFSYFRGCLPEIIPSEGEYNLESGSSEVFCPCYPR